jgi:hypothetical protein
MLFLYRPRETWMPFAMPRQRTDQAAYNRELQQQFDTTHRVAPPAPAAAPVDVTSQLRALAEMRATGALTEAEFAAAKARVLGP